IPSAPPVASVGATTPPAAIPGTIPRATTPAPPPPPQNVAARVQAPPPPPFRQTLPLRVGPDADAVKPPKTKRISASMEEAVGTNWLPKIGIVMVVLGAGWFLASRWELMSAIVRSGLFYCLAGGLLGAGIYWERKENFKILGRVLIGGGWAILYITTAAANHWRSAQVLDSVVVDLFLLLLVAGLM